MPVFISRNLLLCVVPTVIALVSAYWFRRKKKFKPNAITNTCDESNKDLNTASVSTVNSSTDDIKIESGIMPKKLVRTSQGSLVDAVVYQSDIVNSAEISRFSQSNINSLSNHIDVPKQALQEDASFSSSPNVSSVSELNDESENSSDIIVADPDIPVKKTHHLNVNAQEFTYVMSENTLQNDKENIVSADGECFKDAAFCSQFFDDSNIENLSLSKSAITNKDSFEELQDIESKTIESKNHNDNSLDDIQVQRSYLSKSKDSFSSVLDGGSLSDENPPSTSDSGTHSINDLEESFENSKNLQNNEVSSNSVLTSTSPVLSNGITSEVPCLVNESLDLLVSNEQDHVEAEPQSGNVSPKDSGIFLSSPTNHYSTSSLTNSDETLILEETQLQDQPPVRTWAQMAANNTSFTSSHLPISQLSSNNVVNGEYSNGVDDTTTTSSSIKDEDYQMQQLNINEHLSDISHTSSWSCFKNDNFKTSDISGYFVYEFELPQDLCGRLIGRAGRSVKFIKERSRANVFIKRHAFDPQLKVVVVEGHTADVYEALDIIRRKYPPSEFPNVTLSKTNVIPTPVLPDHQQLHLAEGTSCDIILSSLKTAGHFFVQQVTHPTYPNLTNLVQQMTVCYSQTDTPPMPEPIEPGVICAAPIYNGWFRATVVNITELDSGAECIVKFSDYGGFKTMPVSTLRQIRSDFMTLPLQATECYLANVKPIDPETGWSVEATCLFEELAQGQILQAWVVEYALDGKPCVHLYGVKGIQSTFINRTLVDRGMAVWVNSGHWADNGPAPPNYH